MAHTIKATIEGVERDAIESEFTIHNEDWNEYHLMDGGRCRTKLIVQGIYRVVDEDGKQLYNDDGTPVFVVNHRIDVVTRP